MSKLTANQRSPSMVTESSTAVTPAAVDVASGSKVSFILLRIELMHGWVLVCFVQCFAKELKSF